ncbi:hypothetical protein NM688_g6736 [Phlebia brevispora]|uniref:Uncharacterized protein n=1 Tax=Phlebia brevispora TaxID=194682 RepID=A0ACC1SD82_9APHY|nr:hypothetical protein NM688_g6736 [Phlebia brevispora]
MKGKCKPTDVEGMCSACTILGIPCEYTTPIHKRGPPKGYILALERRLRQVEALLGTIIGSDDPRARGLIGDLSRDQLATYIINRVKAGPFCTSGQAEYPSTSTKEHFLAAIMTDSVDESPGSFHLHEETLSPDRDWQDRLQKLFTSSPQGNSPQYAHAAEPYLPPQSLMIMKTLPTPYPTKLQGPVPSDGLLAPLGTSQYPCSTDNDYAPDVWDGTSSKVLQQKSFPPRTAQNVKKNHKSISPSQTQMRDCDTPRSLRHPQPSSTPPHWYFTREATS